MVYVLQELCKVYIRLDQPTAALALYEAASQRQPSNTSLLLGCARIHDALNDVDKGLEVYKQVLALDASSVEAIACLASHSFYTDQPEIALRYYRRLLQMGVSNAEIWNNLGLCCFYASQYDMCLSCFERALSMADDSSLPDVWYNIGQVAVGIGDLGWAHQCFRLALCIDPNHAEAYNNLGVLELRKGNDEQARAHFRTGQNLAEHVFELHYNGALLAQRQGDLQEALQQVDCALQAYPEHTDSLELKRLLKAQLTVLS
eukprot:jgi/Chrzof1/9547/Cz04g07120.t1